MASIEGMNIIITGANSGIGYHMMMKLLSKGNRIMAVDKNTDVLCNVDGIIPFECDVSSKDGVDSIFDEASKHFDKIDLFVANAGFHITRAWIMSIGTESIGYSVPMCTPRSIHINHMYSISMAEMGYSPSRIPPWA